MLARVVPFGQFDDPTCRPYYSAFGQIESNCSLGIGNLFWAFALGIPRLIITPGVITIAIIKSTLENGSAYWSDALNALPFLVVSIPISLLIWLSFSYWRQKNTRLAYAIISIILAETAIWGFLA